MNWFVNYIYREANAKLGTSFEPGQDPATDNLATRIAIETGINNGFAPATVLNLLNEGLGKSFTMTDYNRAAKEFGFPVAAEVPTPAPAPAPAQVNLQDQSAAAPDGLLAEGADMATGISPSVIDRLTSIPRNEFETVGFQQGGKDYSMDPNGLISVRDVGAKPTDEVQVFDQGGNFLASHAVEQRSDFVQAINQAGRVGIPAAIGAAILGPLGTGLLSTPTAAAVGSGGSTLLHGGSVEDALKAAALAGLTAYGLDYLTASPELLAARELASSGMSEDAIIDTLISRGVSTNAAIEAASNATGLPAAGANRGIGTVTPTGTAPLGGVIESTSLAGAGNLAGAVAPAAAATALPVTSAQTPGLLNQQVQVQSQTGGTQQAATTAIPAAGAGLLAQTQTVPVTSQTAPTTQQAAGPGGAMLGTAIAPTQTVPIETRTIPTQDRAVTIPVVASESVTVPGKREPVPTATALIPAGAAGAAAGVTAPATPTSPFSATDAALAALLLGGAGSLLNQSQEGGFTMDPNLANAIINAPRPTYRGGVGGYQMPGMFQIAPTNVYNPFATTAPFGTGRFGGFSAPITLPRGLV